MPAACRTSRPAAAAGPPIQQPITGGSGQITGNFTPSSANDLAVLLRAGALPATLDVAEERSVGPSLGADSIKSGLTAGVVAALLVVTFMVVAYGLFGLFADISLGLNIILIVASLSLLGAGLAGLGVMRRRKRAEAFNPNDGERRFRRGRRFWKGP